MVQALAVVVLAAAAASSSSPLKISQTASKLGRCVWSSCRQLSIRACIGVGWAAGCRQQQKMASSWRAAQVHSSSLRAPCTQMQACPSHIEGRRRAVLRHRMQPIASRSRPDYKHPSSWLCTQAPHLEARRGAGLWHTCMQATVHLIKNRPSSSTDTPRPHLETRGRAGLRCAQPLALAARVHDLYGGAPCPCALRCDHFVAQHAKGKDVGRLGQQLVLRTSGQGLERLLEGLTGNKRGYV